MLSHLRPRTWASWAVTSDGIVFAEDMPDGKRAIMNDAEERQISMVEGLR